jgi:hypothetical protein
MWGLDIFFTHDLCAHILSHILQVWHQNLDEEAGMVGDGSAESSHHRITQALHRRCCHCLVCGIFGVQLCGQPSLQHR